MEELNSKEKNAVTIRTAKEIQSTIFPPEEYLVANLLPETGFTILAGPPKSGKSYFALDLCHSISAESTFLNRMKITKNGSVLYLSLEDGERRLQARMNQMKVECNDSFYIATSWKYYLGGVKDLGEYLGKNKDIVLVVIDTLVCFGRGREEGSFQVDYDFVNKFKSLSENFKVSILLIHHTKKSRDEADILNDIYGTNGLIAAADTVLVLQRNRKRKDTKLFCSSRDYAQAEYSLVLDENCRWVCMDEIGQPASSPERQKILDVLIEFGELSPAKIFEKLGNITTPKNISNLLAGMKKEGIVDNGNQRGIWKASVMKQTNI